MTAGSEGTFSPKENHLLLEWHKYAPLLTDRAFKARERAVSHRKIPFLVGAAALVFDPKNGALGIIDGANYKPMPRSDGPRKCAEEEILEEAERLGLEIIGIVIVAPHQPDDETGIDLGITPCCIFCRKHIRMKIEDKTRKSAISLDTHLQFVNADLPTTRVAMSVQQMLDIFNGR